MSPPTNNVNKTWALLQTTGVKDEQVTCWWDDVRFVIEQHALLKQMSAGRHVAPLGHIILILKQPVLAIIPS